ncbi:hypothetical protein K440DRAFT_580807 [Wilcoxina mikolae CBS 423.85]|nr:hypothetical protein K440DRAFT_580807 [Wilcoxina mikolae CBS 423.85]
MLMLSNKSLCSCLAAFTLLGNSVAQAASNGPVYPGLAGLKYFFAFGDSYTATSFNLTDGSPLPTSGNPLGNPTYPGWTSSNGPNWIDYLTVQYNKSEVLTFDFAYGGATIDSALVAPWKPTVLSLKQQVEDLFLGVLQSRKSSIAPWKPENTLFLIWIGINDIGNTYGNNNFTFHTTLLDEYFGLVNKLYASGARNFLFIDVPPVDRSPLTTSQGAASAALEKTALADYNSKLLQRVIDLKKTKRGVWAKLFESSKVFNKILDHPTQYGFKNTTAYCDAYVNGTPEWNTFIPECGEPVDKYFWLNNLHPTHLVHQTTAKELAKVL